MLDAHFKKTFQSANYGRIITNFIAWQSITMAL